MKCYTVTEISNKVKEVPAGVVIDGVLYKGVGLDDLMKSVSGLSDEKLDAMLAFCRKLTIEQQQEALISWSGYD
jgi:hypothetical protein